MSEFHARPLEIDRRNNVKSSKSIAPSKNSTHIFDREDNNATTKIDSKNPFKNIGIQDKIADALVSSTIFGLKQPTVIQKKVLSALLVDSSISTQRSNLFIQSETGSGKVFKYCGCAFIKHIFFAGKTFAYLLPIIQVS